MSDPPRWVLDTNVCLDLWVFDDPLGHLLLQRLHDGRIQLLSDDACRDEWLRVLAYPKLGLSASVQAAAIDAYDALAYPLPAAERRPPIRLPRCADPDDQKFLELAYAGAAQWLLSRDLALLQLARRVEREAWFRIQSPVAWHASLSMVDDGQA